MARVNRKLRERLTRRRIITRLIISSLMIISVGLIFISRTNDTRFFPLRNKVEAAGGSIVSVVKAPFRKVGDGLRYIGDLRTLHRDNQALRRENTALRQYKFRTQTLEAKSQRLEQMMRVQSGLDIPSAPIAVRVVTEPRGPFAYSVLVNSGQSSGVKTGYPVMHERGLLGHVIRVGNGSSRVLVLQDLNSRVSVMSRETEARAVLIGKNDQPPQLEFYDDASKWKNGTEVVTSGDDGILPQGLPVGQIIKRRDDDIRVSLFPRGRVDWAWVYPFEAVETPEDDPAKEDERETVKDKKAEKKDPKQDKPKEDETEKNEAESEGEP